MEEICSLCGKCSGWMGGIPSSLLISPKHYNNDQEQQQEPLLDYNKSDQYDPISYNNDSSKQPDTTIRQSGNPEKPGGAEPTPATKARLWDSISQKLKKVGRKDQSRYGLAVSDLSTGELELVTKSGWQQETTETGISILWAPEKAAKALAVSA